MAAPSSPLGHGDIWGRAMGPPPPSLCTQRASFFSPSYATARTCWRYKAGAATTYTLPRHRVYVLTNTTAWVEARWGPHLHRSPNLTLNLNEAGKRREAGLGAPPRCRSPQPRCPRSEAGSSPRWDEFRQGQGAPAAPGAAAAVARQGAGAEQGGSLPRGGQPQLDAGKVLVARSRGGVYRGVSSPGCSVGVRGRRPRLVGSRLSTGIPGMGSRCHP